MELRQLEAFVAVAEERNFTRAAARLHVAQSGLSATIRSLERELKAPLFSRTTRHVELTAAGAALLAEARRTLSSAHAAIEAVAAVQGVQRGTLTVGIMQTPLFDLPGLIARYRSAYPGIELRIRQAGSTELGRLLGERSVDVIFRAVADESSGFVSIPLARSFLAVVCNADHALAGNAAVDLRALSDSALAGYPLGWEVRTLSDRALRSTGVEPRYAFEVNDTRTLLDLVEIGLGVAVFPEAIAASRGARLRKIAISGRRWDWTVRAEALAPGPSNPAARALWTMLPDQEPTLTGA
jgi:DNA-binding transcriptional LysR family regulator